MKAKILLRWLAIAGFGGYGIYTLIASLLHVLAQPDVHWAVFWFFLLPFMLVYCGLFIATAYFILRRQYRDLCTLVSALAAVVVFGVLISLPENFGVQERLHDWGKDSPWVILIALPVSLAALFIPFYAARWAYRRGQALLSRYVLEGTQPERSG